jgi:hypothetical protein
MMLIQAVSEAHPVWLQEVLNAYHTDQKAQELLISLAVSSLDDKGYSLHKGIIYYKHKGLDLSEFSTTDKAHCSYAFYSHWGSLWCKSYIPKIEEAFSLERDEE